MNEFRSEPTNYSGLGMEHSPLFKQDDLHKERAQKKISQALEGIMAHMVEQRITKSQLSRLMNCYPSYVQSVFDERETRGLTLQTLERVADALNFEVVLKITPKPSTAPRD